MLDKQNIVCYTLYMVKRGQNILHLMQRSYRPKNSDTFTIYLYTYTSSLDGGVCGVKI